MRAAPRGRQQYVHLSIPIRQLRCLASRLNIRNYGRLRQPTLATVIAERLGIGGAICPSKVWRQLAGLVEVLRKETYPVYSRKPLGMDTAPGWRTKGGRVSTDATVYKRTFSGLVPLYTFGQTEAS